MPKIKATLQVYNCSQLIQTIDDYEMDLSVLVNNKPSLFITVCDNAESIARFLLNQKLFPKDADKYVYDTSKVSGGEQVSHYRYPGITPNYSEDDPSIASILPARRDHKHFCKVIFNVNQQDLEMDW